MAESIYKVRLVIRGIIEIEVQAGSETEALEKAPSLAEDEREVPSWDALMDAVVIGRQPAPGQETTEQEQPEK